MDLTKILIKAKKKSNTWSYERCRRVLNKISQLENNLVIDDDHTSGLWAIILVPGFRPEFHSWADPVCYIGYEFPLAIIQASVSKKIVQLLENERLTVIVVPDFVSQEYSIDLSKFPELFPRVTWDPTIDPNEFSISELVYVTYD